MILTFRSRYPDLTWASEKLLEVTYLPSSEAGLKLAHRTSPRQASMYPAHLVLLEVTGDYLLNYLKCPKLTSYLDLMNSLGTF